jgi:Tol biopolymer transport system component
MRNYRYIYALFLLLLTACFQASPKPEVNSLFTDADIDKASLEFSSSLFLEAAEGEVLAEPQSVDAASTGLSTQAVLPGAKGYLAYIWNNPTITTTPWRIIRHNQLTDSFTTLYGGVRRISSVAISSDGNTLIFTMQETTSASSDDEVYKMIVSPRQVTRLTNNLSSEANASMSGNASFFVWEGDNATIAGLRNVFIRNNATADLTALSPTIAQTQPSISSNGNYIALLRPSSTHRVMLYNRSTNIYSVLRNVSRTLNSPSPSDDGKKVAWLENIGSSHTIYLRNLTANTISPLYSSTNILEHSFLTADGNFLAFAETINGVSSIYTRDLSTNLQVQLSVNAAPINYFSPYWQQGALSSSCSATNQGPFTTIVNTPLFGGTRTTGKMGVEVALLLAEICTQSVTSFSGALHGTVSANTSKGFKYIPNFQYIGTDSFSFTLSDGSSATVSINITDSNTALSGAQYVWYVDNAAATSGNGSASSPFKEIALAEANSSAGDTLYISSGNANPYIGTIDMKANQRIIGQGVRFLVDGIEVADPGTAPIIEASQYGLILGNYSDTSSPAADIGTLEVKGITIQNISGGPTSSHLGSGIKSDNLRGKVLIEDVTVRNVSGHGLYLDHNDLDKPEEHDITLRNLRVENPGQHGIWIDDPTNLLIEGGHITGVQKTVLYSGVAIDPQDEFGNYGAGKSMIIRNVQISGGANVVGIRVMKNNRYVQNEQSFSKENTLVTIEGNTINVGGRGIFVESYYGSECFTKNGVRKTEIYEGDQGDIVLSGSVANVVTAAEKYVEKGLTATLINNATTCGATFSEGADVGDKIKGSIIVQ